ncbi:MAG: N-6 DNA methylase [Candidatus Aminicenantes bacterium]|nr:N-6 DNA methylase [Candidatus Aminicenantes bacterium]
MSKQLTEQFRYGLEQLDMLDTESHEFQESSGLVFTDSLSLSCNNYERLALEKARKYKADAIYFRRFENRMTSIPQVYIYDFTSVVKDVNDEDIGELHRKLWNSGQTPMFFIFTRTEIKIFNCLKSPDFDPETEKITATPMETINLAADIEDQLEKEKLNEFSAGKFDNGSFWDTSKYREEFQLKDSSYEKLLEYLKEVRDHIIKEKKFPKPIIDKLLVMSILLKYLEDRTDPEGNKVFPVDFFHRFSAGARNFTDILKEKGACLRLFDYLSKHFNGEIFQWEDEKERALLAQTDLRPLALFSEARSETGGQRTLWPLYSFNDLPIELISNIYEEFLGKGNKKGVVYTPPYLVHFLIDESMPLESPRENFKVLDPACGSGVFLVAAYQRIIDWWRIRNDWKKPELATLKKLLKENIYGVDIEPGAVRLTIFSLSLVLLDELSPKEIWENLKFDNLEQSGNLFEKDFFHLLRHGKMESQFDLVIGNPPFKSSFDTGDAKYIEILQQKQRPPVPDNQLALLFLEQSTFMCKEGGLLCLIVPTGPFLYNVGSLDFRTYFLQLCNVIQILDFTPLSNILFCSANVAAAAVFARKEEPNLKTILHATFRRTKVSKEKIYFQLDHYDFHRVAYKYALNSPLIWKANLLGGGRLHGLISRLSEFRTLGRYLEEKIKNNGWVVAEGFIIGNKNEIARLQTLADRVEQLTNEEIEELSGLQKKYKKADHLTGAKTLPTEALAVNGIDKSKICTLKEKYFLRPRVENKDIFKGPHVLIKEVAGADSIPVALVEEDLCFMHQVIGVHSPKEDIEELKQIENRIQGNRAYLFHPAVFSGRYMIGRATSILKKDIDNLPYPEDKNDFDFSEVENILMDDVLDYMLEFRRKGENSSAMAPVTRAQLLRFGETYCKMLNAVYEKFKPHEPVEADNFIYFPVYYGEKPELETTDPAQFEKSLNQLVHKTLGRNLKIARVLRLYDKNVIYLIKPKQARYWLRSAAVRDADETYEDLIKQGY